MASNSASVTDITDAEQAEKQRKVSLFHSTLQRRLCFAPGRVHAFPSGITFAYGKMQLGLHFVELATFLVRNSK